MIYIVTWIYNILTTLPWGGGEFFVQIEKQGRI